MNTSTCSKSIYDYILDLQNSGDKYTIVECGNGAAVANLIYSIPGASKLIEDTYQPYSKEAQEEWLGVKLKRSVSLETINLMMSKIEGPCLVTQFQLQGKDTKVLTHGYIGVRGKHGQMIYHISVYKNNEFDYDTLEEEVNVRIDQLNNISNLGILLMTKFSLDTDISLSNQYIDGVFFKDSYNHNETLRILGNCNTADTFVPYHKDGWKRMEDFVRGSEGIIFIRGSFNPVHKGHVDMYETTIKKFPNYKAAFLISLHNRDKDNVSPKEAIERAEVLSKLGYEVIFSSLPYFNDTVSTFNKRWPDIPVIFPVGLDTINRFLDDIVKTEKEIVEGLTKITKDNGKWKESPLNKLSDEEYAKDHSAWKIFHKHNWKNKKFLVFERSGYSLNNYAKYFSNIIEIEGVYKDHYGLSSTKIRNGEQTSGL